MDSLRRQVIRHSVLEVLEMHLPKLIQSFQLYGKDGATPTSFTNTQDTSSTISLDGFLDFLNAYFEYEEYFTYQQAEKVCRFYCCSCVRNGVSESFVRSLTFLPLCHLEMVREMKDAFAVHSVEPELEPQEMHFAHFIELFCRVAVEFHNQILVREGAQVRRAIESSRLEFSIELLLQHMNIKIIRDSVMTESQSQHDQAIRYQPNSDADQTSSDQATEHGLTELTVEVENLLVDENKTFESLIDDIRIHLDAQEKGAAGTSAVKHPKRGQSVLFSRLPPRKAPSGPDSCFFKVSTLGGHVGVSDKIPFVTLIREPVSPPELPLSVLAKLESAITYQNLGQHHVCLQLLLRLWTRLSRTDLLYRLPSCFKDGA